MFFKHFKTIDSNPNSICSSHSELLFFITILYSIKNICGLFCRSLFIHRIGCFCLWFFVSFFIRSLSNCIWLLFYIWKQINCFLTTYYIIQLFIIWQGVFLTHLFPMSSSGSSFHIISKSKWRWFIWFVRKNFIFAFPRGGGLSHFFYLYTF